jgi:hypothetical protein
MSDPELLIPIFGMLTGVLVTWGIVWGIVQVMKLRRSGGSLDAAVEGELVALREQLDQMQHQLAEAHERIDFTERLLAQPRGPEQFPKGAS